MMINSTFRHLKGIGAKKEQEIWNSGILYWSDFESRIGTQLSLFPEQDEYPNTSLYTSHQALNKEDIDFFAKNLPSEDYYRIALTFPNKTLFLDIETTGLSHYYDNITIIGWSIENDYGVFIQGTDETYFKEVLSKAKIIVTFNGTLFDLPFLKKEFPDIQFPLTHIDLRFLSKRVGLSGGQKAIEKNIGMERQFNLNNLTGETAPVLWFKYLKGDLDSLKLLISYNHADIEGMKKIFDVTIERLMENQRIPVSIRPKYRFSNHSSRLKWTKIKNQQNHNLIKLYQEQKKSMISFNKLNGNEKLSGLRIVGIDLSGSENRASGWCFLEGNKTQTQRLKSNIDIIEATLQAQPHLIAIDSPLSLPKGRSSVSDDDPEREAHGITRSCERLLKKRGINVYPCLIKSMQNLTERGIYLATYFRSLGIPVIEVYPGAAQDIMRIPRKQAGLEFLKDGLIDFGICGEFQQSSVSHDELDAITSAIVGLFFWSGQFEALGSEEEDYLIIPSPSENINQWKDQKVIGLSGAIASGKTTASMILQNHGFSYTRFSLVLADILKQRGIEPNRKNLQQLGLEVNRNLGQRWLCKELIQRLPKEGNLVVDGLRFPEDHAFLVERFGTSFLHIHIDIPKEVRLERYIGRGGSEQEFIQASSRPTETNIPKLASLAHRVVSETSELNTLLSEITKMVNYTKQPDNELTPCLLQL